MSMNVDGENGSRVSKGYQNEVWHMKDEGKQYAVKKKCELKVRYVDAIFELHDGEPILDKANMSAIQPAEMEDVRVQVKKAIVKVDLVDVYLCFFEYKEK
ncbi:hypothetical protein ACH5RR_029840 [Cinchona calisaya]|uniref:Uncharacterized protein n=1 Tax=Cinchona calisaya TaxID=153742 RepID=A0ABD2YUA5_9GENT